jgi:hypothetical protein
MAQRSALCKGGIIRVNMTSCDEYGGDGISGAGLPDGVFGHGCDNGCDTKLRLDELRGWRASTAHVVRPGQEIHVRVGIPHLDLKDEPCMRTADGPCKRHKLSH